MRNICCRVQCLNWLNVAFIQLVCDSGFRRCSHLCFEHCHQICDFPILTSHTGSHSNSSMTVQIWVLQTFSSRSKNEMPRAFQMLYVKRVGHLSLHIALSFITFIPLQVLYSQCSYITFDITILATVQCTSASNLIRIRIWIWVWICNFEFEFWCHVRFLDRPYRRQKMTLSRRTSLFVP